MAVQLNLDDLVVNELRSTGGERTSESRDWSHGAMVGGGSGGGWKPSYSPPTHRQLTKREAAIRLGSQGAILGLTMAVLIWVCGRGISWLFGWELCDTAHGAVGGGVVGMIAALIVVVRKRNAKLSIVLAGALIQGLALTSLGALIGLLCGLAGLPWWTGWPLGGGLMIGGGGILCGIWKGA